MGNRRLTSKKLRALLWYAADGKCQLCGCGLGDDWHADHVVPWSVSGRTNVHEMQALCRSCNLKKGATYVQLRQHQRDVERVVKDIKSGLPITRILVSVTPGGGKSLLPVIAAKELIPSKADKICWIAPRKNLTSQAEAIFVNGKWMRHFGHNCQIRALIDGNSHDPARKTQGYATTYQAVGANPDLHRHEFDRYRYILVLDEPHHVVDEGEWDKALTPLIDRAMLLIAMSGTWERGDGKFISQQILPYKRTMEGYRPDLVPSEHTEVVSYSRIQALQERAIKRLVFEQGDAHTMWVDRNGEEQQAISFGDAGEHVNAALFTALSTEYGYHLLGSTLEHWRAHRTNTNPRSKMLVVVHKQTRAEEYFKHLKSLGFRVGIATSNEGKDSIRAINKFKRHDGSALDILVTVQMAYEGLDVPSITHIACLTHIRSKPWIEQMLNRATRVDYDCGLPWEEQFGFVYAPDDPLFNGIAARIMEDQAAVVHEREPRPGNGGNGDEPRQRGQSIPITSTLTRERGVDATTGEVVDYETSAVLRQIMKEHGIHGVSLVHMKQVIDAYHGHEGQTAKAPVMDMPGYSEREQRMRRDIEVWSRSVDAYLGEPFGTTNRKMYKVFKKSRDHMDLNELAQAWAWLQQNYSEVFDAN